MGAIALRTADILAVEDGAWRGRWLWKQVDAATTANGGLLTVHDYFYSQADVVTRTAASATPTTRKGTPMTLLACSCGYEAGAPVDLGDHLGEVFIPGDDTAPDGRVHAEAARDGTFTALAALRCACGFTTGDTASMDGHLLRVFIPDDAIGLDGRKHVCAQAA